MPVNFKGGVFYGFAKISGVFFLGSPCNRLQHLNNDVYITVNMRNQ